MPAKRPATAVADPAVISRMPAGVPQAALDAHLAGTVTVRERLGPQGLADSVRAVSNHPRLRARAALGERDAVPGLVATAWRGADGHDTPAQAREVEREAEPWPALQARWLALGGTARFVFQVDVMVCPRCGGAMRILAFVTEPAVVRRIQAHLQRRGLDARAGPWSGGAGAAGQARA